MLKRSSSEAAALERASARKAKRPPAATRPLGRVSEDMARRRACLNTKVLKQGSDSAD